MRIELAHRYRTLTGLLLVSWVTMTVSHEVGHLVGGWCGGATLTEYSIAPWGLPYSLHNPDPNPKLTLWAGPLLGVMMPIALAVTVRRWWCWFVADFCLLANGVYLAVAWWAGDRFLDTPRLLAAGAAPLSIIAFCSATIALGYVRFRADCVDLLSREAREPPTQGLEASRSKTEDAGEG